ncbi:MAG: enoyl-CoA hydratase/isomerase family protein [Proteobacteria bacterium]|nr:enoyl-CoA hydratase/isomerase family protein [Pseudomonadota bacterium]
MSVLPRVNTENVVTEVDGHVAWIWINHPERHNAFDLTTQTELTQAFRACGSDPAIGAIVLSGKGDKAFCAGGYLKDLAGEPDVNQLHQLFVGTVELVNAIRATRQPVIAAVNGYAMGGGNELVVACDFAIASDRAVLGQTGPRVGSAPVVGGTNMLALMIGEKRAKEVSFLCRRYTAQQALEYGWINEVAPHAALRERVEAWCAEILALSPRYLEIAKVSSNYWWDLLQPGFNHGARLLAASAGSAEMREGASAFMEKRKPDFMQFRK